MNYDVVIGIEIHLELLSNTKMFSSAPYEFKKEANTCVNEIDLAYPGVLPSVNEKAVESAIMTCLALNMEIDPLIKFDRKNYYYSDLPKGFQITQQFNPIGKNGYIEIYLDGNYKRIRINRAHMEEDTAKQYHLNDETLIDYNRAGVPLLEIVSEPDISSGKEAATYVEKLRQTLEYIGVSDCKMEEGSLRCDINISLKEENSKILGTKVEIKNLNSISNIKDALDYEIERQKNLLNEGKSISQETRRFDEKSMTTILMRKKEASADYKYFPEPNIMPIRISDEMINNIKNSLAELPDAKTKRYIDQFKLSEYDVEVILANKNLCLYFDEAVKDCLDPKQLCNLCVSELMGLLSKNDLTIETCPIKASDIKDLSNIISKGEISSKQGKEVLELMLNGKSAKEIIEEKGLKQNSNIDELLVIIKDVLNKNKQSIDDYKNGKDRALSYLIGQVMKISKGQANPSMVNELILEELSKL